MPRDKKKSTKSAKEGGRSEKSSQEFVYEGKACLATSEDLQPGFTRGYSSLHLVFTLLVWRLCLTGTTAMMPCLHKNHLYSPLLISTGKGKAWLLNEISRYDSSKVMVMRLTHSG